MIKGDLPICKSKIPSFEIHMNTIQVMAGKKFQYLMYVKKFQLMKNVQVSKIKVYLKIWNLFANYNNETSLFS